ncbi:M10 family metallopeptidase C-terminal domain-containing protein [Salipiger marinus]|uniref:M10 family metallopeptidase C-terminal domain-containing protein n=1 Tax=Salipiger marinus TaxID=555512 RepID=UPI001E5F0B78|nr:M10 family metallopeptidase C-terminal domain-containing protein [Salipiger manganoxidans]MCD1620482.1 M10 family metallopeptidase C-terminal domain-containing protein [Salipiger manganoxidans]MEB3422162.1 M10 family metallopeptidase C-terminal domain-containing protein [Salipiger manganoxidans]
MITVTLRLPDSPSDSYYEWQGTSGDDAITGFSGQTNWLFGNDGDDLLSSGRGEERDLLFGGNGSDTLKGGLGGDRLDGGLGSDLMMGGREDDVYYVDDSGDVVVERAAWLPVLGGDVVFSSVDFDFSGLAIERLALTGSAIFGTGNRFSNLIVGGDADNILDGGRGIDTLIGGDGDDTYILRHAQDTATEPGISPNLKFLEATLHGHDTVLAHNSYRLMLGIEDIFLQEVVGKTGELVGGLTTFGNNLDNLVVGNSTDNNISGRTGNDTLTGGGGADDFIFSDELGARHADVITDFTPGEDRIVISGARVDMDSGAPDADAFHLGAEATAANHRLLFDGTTLRYDADGTGDAAALEIATFEGMPTLTTDEIFVT